MTVSTLILMSVDLYHESLDTIEAEGVMVNWYSSLGLRDGMLVSASSDSGATDGWNVEWHKPAFCLLPIFMLGGPGGGRIGIAVWLLVPLLTLAIFLFRKLIEPSAQPARWGNHP